VSKIERQLHDLVNWNPPGHFQKITVLDAHTGGEPLRIVLDGLPEVKGATILEKRNYLKEHLDVYRKLLMWEPRGHADMYGAIVTAPVLPDSDFGILFLHNEGYSSMCGHGIIAIAKVAVETGLVIAKEPVTMIKIDAPAGQITAYANVHSGKVSSVHFQNVPSYVALKDAIVTVPSLGDVRFDLAFGGAFYAYVNASEVRVSMTVNDCRELIDKGMAIKNAVMEQFPVVHPFENDLSFLYGTIFIGPAHSKGADSRNVCVFADGELDRSPTGTGVSGRMALHYHRGDVQIGQELVIESITGSRFVSSVISEVPFGGYDAVITKVGGTAFISGKNTLLIDPEDLFSEGFFLR
jgi:trans-L-3-hydroxyproline dehydratase